MGIRLTPLQRQSWKAAATQAGHKTLSSWLRSLATQAAHTHETGREVATELAALRLALSRVGNNLNQLARYSHETQQAQSLHEVLKDIRLIMQQVNQTLQSLNRSTYKTRSASTRSGKTPHDYP